MDTEGAVYLMNAKCGARDVDDKGDEGCAPPLHSPSFFPPPPRPPSLLYEPSLNYNFFQRWSNNFPLIFFFFYLMVIPSMALLEHFCFVFNLKVSHGKEHFILITIS